MGRTVSEVALIIASASLLATCWTGVVLHKIRRGQKRDQATKQ